MGSTKPGYAAAGQVRSYRIAGHRIIPVLLITGMLMFTGGMLMRTASAGGTQGAGGQLYRYYAVVRVSSGDTLWDIAARYQTPADGSIRRYIREIMAFNSMTDSLIISGQTLIVPYYSTELK